MDHNYKYIKFTKTLEEVLADKKLLWTSRAVIALDQKILTNRELT